MTHVVTMEKGTCILTPLIGAHTATMVFMHGLGDTSLGWRDQAEEWATRLPHVKFVLPSAPVQRVTMNGGMSMPSWYDIIGLSERENEECPGIEESQKLVTSLIRKEISEFKISPSRIVLGGFSQGAALSLWTALQWAESSESLAAVVCLSGYLPAAKKISLTEQGKATPVFQAHGSRDPLIKMSVANKTKLMIQELAHAAKYEYKVYQQMAHSACQEEMDDLMSFLNTVVPAGPAKDPKDMSVRELKQALREKGINEAQFLYKADMVAALGGSEL